MIEAVIFDWAGTTVDYGCFAPVQAFMGGFWTFRHRGDHGRDPQAHGNA